eukprot:6880-Heterococcus_DN1.PRE.1
MLVLLGKAASDTDASTVCAKQRNRAIRACGSKCNRASSRAQLEAAVATLKERRWQVMCQISGTRAQ